MSDIVVAIAVGILTGAAYFAGHVIGHRSAKRDQADAFSAGLMCGIDIVKKATGLDITIETITEADMTDRLAKKAGAQSR